MFRKMMQERWPDLLQAPDQGPDEGLLEQLELKDSRPSLGQQADDLVESSCIQPTNTINAEYIIGCEELELGMTIGLGFPGGKVYHGKWWGVDIAAKEYMAWDEETEPQASEGFTASGKPNKGTQQVQDALLREAGVMAKFTHPNLVRLCGVCLDPPVLVMEYYQNRDMYSMLDCARLELVQADVEQHRTNKYLDFLSWERRLQMLHDVASGIMYLHSRCYVHGDLRSPNLYVTESGRVKIGHFRFMQRLQHSKEVIRVDKVTHPRWMAPEWLSNGSKSTASDVYSFGIIMYEMLTFKIPFEEFTKPEVAIRVLAHAARPKIPSFEELPPTTSRICLSNYIQLMQECWHQDPTQRPSFSTVARRLKAMQCWLLACDSALQGRLNGMEPSPPSSPGATSPVSLFMGMSLGC